MPTSRYATAIGAVVAVALSAGWALAGGPAIPDTPAGRCASAYLAAFNSGDQAALRRFETEHRAKSASRRRSLDERVARCRSQQAEWGSLEVRNVLSSGDHDLLVVVEPQQADGWLHLAFELEDEPPHGLLAVRVEGPLDPKASAASNKRLDKALRKRVVDRVADELARSYAFEEVGRKMAQDIRGRLAAGEYDNVEYSCALAQRLTDDLRAICHDKHLKVLPRIPVVKRGQRTTDPGRDPPKPEFNHGFAKVEVLPGNVGYIKLNGFAISREARPTAAAAMALVANTDALIFDLTANGGGSGEMICLLCGYLFDKPVHLNSFHHRTSGTVMDTYSDEIAPEKRYGQHKPVYVLTSGYTFSAAEEFTYDLKHLERATIVGETTGGGAHPVDFVTLSKHFILKVPFGRAVNPITKTNWEGVGVIPHVEVPADQARKRAYELALQTVTRSDADSSAG